jgi:hypothetical protein
LATFAGRFRLEECKNDLTKKIYITTMKTKLVLSQFPFLFGVPTIQLTIYSGGFAAPKRLPSSIATPTIRPQPSILRELRLVCEKTDRLEEFCHLVLGLCGILAIGFALFLG